jgi:hypothetical protein
MRIFTDRRGPAVVGISAAADGGDIDAAALQLELALFTTGKLNCEAGTAQKRCIKRDLLSDRWGVTFPGALRSASEPRHALAGVSLARAAALARAQFALLGHQIAPVLRAADLILEFAICAGRERLHYVAEKWRASFRGRSIVHALSNAKFTSW